MLESIWFPEWETEIFQKEKLKFILKKYVFCYIFFFLSFSLQINSILETNLPHSTRTVVILGVAI